MATHSKDFYLVRVSGPGYYDGRVFNTRSGRWENNPALLFAPHGRGDLMFARLSTLRRHLARVARYLPPGGFVLVERVHLCAGHYQGSFKRSLHSYARDERRVFLLKQLTDFKFKKGVLKPRFSLPATR